jgi:hypothetical protein
MRKCAQVALVALAVLMAWPLTASAAPTNDTAKGTGSTQAFPFSGGTGPSPAVVTFNSTANFNGTEPHGTVKATFGPDTYQGEVTCQMVSGADAVVGGYIDRATSSETFGGLPAVSWQVTVFDGDPDMLMFSMGPTPPDLFHCATEPFSDVMTEAQVEVHDG